MMFKQQQQILKFAYRHSQLMHGYEKATSQARQAKLLQLACCRKRSAIPKIRLMANVFTAAGFEMASLASECLLCHAYAV